MLFKTKPYCRRCERREAIQNRTLTKIRSGSTRKWTSRF